MPKQGLNLTVERDSIERGQRYTSSSRTPIATMVVVAVMGASGCSDRAAPRDLPGAEREDSAGIPVVVNPAELPPGQPPWSLSAEPLLEIGLADGAPEELLFSAFNGAVLDDGTIVIANTGTFEVRLFDSSGRHLSSFGREGDGPGEFRSMRLPGVFTGDTLLVFDTRLRRVTVLGPDGAFVRDFRLPEELQQRAVRSLGVLSDGSLVLGSVQPAGRSGLTRTPFTIDVLTPTGEAVRPVGTFPGSEHVASSSATVTYSGMGVLFGRDVVSDAAGDRIAIGTDDAFSIRVYDRSGALLHLIRQPREPHPIDPVLYDQRLRTLTSRPMSPESERLREQNLAMMPRHTTLPAFGALLIDRPGNLWVQESEPRTAWQVFDRDGLLVARLELPEGMEVLDVGEDHLLGRVTDELGVERVRKYGLLKGR